MFATNKTTSRVTTKVKKGDGYKIAKEILESGKAYNKFMQIIKAQGDLREIPTAKFTRDIVAKADGKVYEFDNKKLAQVCRFAGAPEVDVAGVYLYKHLNDSVKKGEKLFTIHADAQGAIDQAYDFASKEDIVKIK